MPVGLGAVADPYDGIPSPDQFAEGSSPFMDLGTPYLAYVVELPVEELTVEERPDETVGLIVSRPRWLYWAGGMVAGGLAVALLFGRTDDQAASSAPQAPMVEVAATVAAAPMIAATPTPTPAPAVAPAPAPEAAPVRVERAKRVAAVDVEKNEPTAAPMAASKKAAALMTQYQRIGRELMLLQKEVGPEVAADLVSQFKSIQIEEASKTAEAREECAEILAELHKGIERRKPIKISDECMNNPLAKDCQ